MAKMQEAIKNTQEAMNLLYDTVHPLKKFAILSKLSKVKLFLESESEPTEFTKRWRRRYASVFAGSKLNSIEQLVRNNEIVEACDIIDRLTAELKTKAISIFERELANQCIKFTKQSNGGFANIPLGVNLIEDIGLITQAEQALKETDE